MVPDCHGSAELSVAEVPNGAQKRRYRMIEDPNFFSSKSKIVMPNQIQTEYHLTEIMFLLF